MNLIGMRFDKLLVISKAKSILGGQKIKRYWGAWNCKCDCGNLIIVKTIDLNRGNVKSCGCLYHLYGKSYKPGQKINRLTTISYSNGKWICLCECGNHIEVLTKNLKSNTKSCGCLKSEISFKNSHKLISGRRKYEPQIASARRIWKSYCYKDKLCNITFEQFLLISQQNCFYCGMKPNTKYNYFNTISSNSSQKAKTEGLFIYNGLDRIDSSKSHTSDNVVACCYNCNRAKNNRSVTDFLSWVVSLNNNFDFNKLQINLINMPSKGSLLTSINCVYKPGYNNGDLTIEEFYFLSQQPCYYCNSLPNNLFNKAKTDKKSSQKAKDNGNFIYNGLDRIDSTQSHNKNNVVPCCKYCNFAKNKLTLIEFQVWINKIQQHQKTKGTA